MTLSNPAVENRTSVYIVEDSDAVQVRLREMLEELPDVRVVGNASRTHQAIDAILTLRPAIVTLDLRLEDGSGVEVLREIKSEPNPPIVIVLTNLSELPYRQHCGKLGADHFFDKANEFPRVVELIAELSRP